MGLSPVTPASIVVTAVYTALLAWGFGLGLQQIWQGFRRPKALLNPVFGNRQAIWIFTVHIAVVSADLFVCGPLALHYKSRLWYWGGCVAVLSASLPVAAYFNRTAQSFGTLIGRWIRLRNLFEISLHVAVAAAAVNWFHYYVLLWWLVAYRYLDVGPRRLIQTLYNTPGRLKARPWAPMLNWIVITVIYVLTFLAVYYEKVIYAAPPAASVPDHVPQPFEVASIVVINLVVAAAFWVMIRRYTDTRPARATASTQS